MDPANGGDGRPSEDSWAEQMFGHKPDASTGECPYACPVCMGLSLVKQMRPEVTAHLIAAGREFLLAARAFMDSMAEPQERTTSNPVQKIHLD